jgi:hypothetical protein
VGVEENIPTLLTSVLLEVSGGIEVRLFMPKKGAMGHVKLTADRNPESVLNVVENKQSAAPSGDRIPIVLRIPSHFVISAHGKCRFSSLFRIRGGIYRNNLILKLEETYQACEKQSRHGRNELKLP